MQNGDKVVYSKYAGTELKVQGGDFVLLKVRHTSLLQLQLQDCITALAHGERDQQADLMEADVELAPIAYLAWLSPGGAL